MVVAFAIGWTIAGQHAYLAMPLPAGLTQRIVAAIRNGSARRG